MSAAIELDDLEPAHSRIGASSMERWANCPGSVAATANMPSKSSEYAEEGTRAHDAAAECLEQGCEAGIFADTPEMAEAIQVYLDHCRALVAEEGEGATMLVEYTFHLRELHPDLFGTADFVLYGPKSKTLYVRDYKHGMGVPVEIEEDGKINLQTLYYATGALLDNKEFKPEWIDVGIVQPRCGHPDGPIRTRRIPAADIDVFVKYLMERVKATEAADAPRIPGDHCRWCSFAGTPCPELAASCNEVAAREFRKDLSYDPQLLADTLKQRGMLQSFIKNLDEFAYSEAVAGRFVGYGWKLVDKEGRRKFRNDDEAVEFLRMLGHTDDEIFDPPTLKSVAQVEKSIGKANKDDLTPLVHKESSGLALVPDSDKRPPAKTDAATAFAHLTTTEEV